VRLLLPTPRGVESSRQTREFGWNSYRRRRAKVVDFNVAVRGEKAVGQSARIRLHSGSRDRCIEWSVIELLDSRFQM
jgi:hypothetical protein